MSATTRSDEGEIPQITLEALARTFHKEALAYGFALADYVRYVNILLDTAMANDHSNGEKRRAPVAKAAKATKLPLVGPHVTIRSLDRDHDQTCFERWLADKDGRRFLLSTTTAKRMNLHQLLDDPRNIIGVITLADKTPVGSVAFLDHDEAQRKAELRKLIGDPKKRGSGLAKEATKLWIQYGVGSLGLKKIYLNTLGTNVRNIKINEELGFKVEGILRNELYYDNEYHDVLRMGLMV